MDPNQPNNPSPMPTQPGIPPQPTPQAGVQPQAMPGQVVGTPGMQPAAPQQPYAQPSYSNPNNSTNYESNYMPYIAPVCTTTALPYSTSYQDVSYMDVGQTSFLGGRDGYKTTCTESSTGYKPADLTIQPYNKVVYVGTRQPTATPSPTYSPSPNYAAKSTCDNQYAQVMAAIANGNAGSSSAVGMAQYAYGQCLRNAGF
jgi:hypothetical protein